MLPSSSAEGEAAAPLVVAKGLGRALAGPEGPVHALQGVDLAIHAGELVALVGPSGSGKSSLLYLLGVLDSPTSGELSLLGAPTAGLKDLARAQLRNRHIGFVFQDHHLLPELSAQDNVALPLILLGESAAASRAKAAALLARLGLGDRLKHRPHQLSGGQQQRTAIARALVHGPSLLLGDEPTGNLDSASGAEVVRLLAEHRQRPGCAVVIATHDPSIAEAADRVLRLVDGRLLPPA